MRVTLIHNQGAGKGAHFAEHDPPALVQAMVRAGYAVTYIRARREDIREAFERPTDLIAIAGGDGTVAKVAGDAPADGPPLAILPLGTANNIASSLDSVRPLEHLALGWQGAEARPFYRLQTQGPWGDRRLMEGIGFGAIEHAIATLGPKKPNVAGARRHMAQTVCDAAPEELTIRLDGEEFSGRFASLEITTIPLVGPKLRLAPDADAAIPAFDLCIVMDTPEQRRDFSDWIADGAAAEKPVPASFRRGKAATISGNYRRLRLNDKLWPRGDRWGLAKIGPITIAAEEKPVHFLVPG